MECTAEDSGVVVVVAVVVAVRVGGGRRVGDIGK